MYVLDRKACMTYTIELLFAFQTIKLDDVVLNLNTFLIMTKMFPWHKVSKWHQMCHQSENLLFKKDTILPISCKECYALTRIVTGETTGNKGKSKTQITFQPTDVSASILKGPLEIQH